MPEEIKTHSENPLSLLHHPAPRRRNYWVLITLILLALLVVSFFTEGFNFFKPSLSSEEAAQKTLEYVNTNLLQGQAVAQVASITEDEGTGLYNLKLSISGREINSYVTKDGQLFFPQVFNLDEKTAESPAASSSPPPEVPKSDQPKVELFVMSHCPYGTQAEKGIIPAVEKLGDKIDFQIKFVYYAMHGEKEVEEEMNQVCLQDEQKEKFLDYLKCFLDEGERESCLAAARADTTKLSACIQKLDTRYQITQKLQDQSSWLNGRFPLFDVYKKENEQYGVQGSPTLVINGQQVSSGRAPADYLKVVCAAFNEAPEECGAELSATAFSAGFGYQEGSSTEASCG